MDDESENLHWHAINYRTAAPQHAEEMWQALTACVERKISAERKLWRDAVMLELDHNGQAHAIVADATGPN